MLSPWILLALGLGLMLAIGSPSYGFGLAGDVRGRYHAGRYGIDAGGYASPVPAAVVGDDGPSFLAGKPPGVARMRRENRDLASRPCKPGGRPVRDQGKSAAQPGGNESVRRYPN